MFDAITLPEDDVQIECQPCSEEPHHSPPEDLRICSAADILEAAADELLAAINCLGHRASTYTERQLRRRIAKDRACAPETDAVGLPQEVHDYLFYRQMSDLLAVARLSLREEIVLRLHLCGLSQRQIARVLKKRRIAVSRLLTKSRRKLQAAYAQGRYAGWYEVYLSEVNRPAYCRRNS